MTERELKQLAIKISAQLSDLTNDEREHLFELICEVDQVLDRAAEKQKAAPPDGNYPYTLLS